jgi:TonB family protein
MGCSVGSKSESPVLKIDLLEKYPIPLIPEKIFHPNMRFYTKLFIDTTGCVADARLISSTGDTEFDAQLIESLKNWRYEPVVYNGKAIKLWVNQDLQVVIADQLYMHLELILCSNEKEASGIYDSLKMGKSFSELAQKYSIDRSKSKYGNLGNVNIYLFPENIQQKVKSLELSTFTRPISYGKNYAIFKRIN